MSNNLLSTMCLLLLSLSLLLNCTGPSISPNPAQIVSEKLTQTPQALPIDAFPEEVTNGDSISTHLILQLVDSLNAWGQDAQSRYGLEAERIIKQLTYSSYFLLNNSTRLLCIGSTGEHDPFFDLFIIQKCELGWCLLANKTIDTRYIPSPQQATFYSSALLFQLTVEQVWSSDGAMSHAIFYDISNGQIVEALTVPSSGGGEYTLKIARNDDCTLEYQNNFESVVRSVTRKKITLEYELSATVASSCLDQATEVNPILKNTKITFERKTPDRNYLPDYSMLSGVDSIEFRSLTSFAETNGLAKILAELRDKNLRQNPETSALLRQYIEKNH